MHVRDNDGAAGTFRAPLVIGADGLRSVVARRAGRSLRSAKLKRIAAARGVSPAQIALAWLLARKPWIVPIPGTRSVLHLEENLQAARVSLSANELAEIDSSLSGIRVQGGRMSEKYMSEVEQT